MKGIYIWIVLCNSNDISAYWAFQGLKQRGFSPLELITADILMSSTKWDHRLGSDNDCIKIVLADGRSINSNSISGVLNRINYLPGNHLMVAEPSERDYAIQEFYAFYISLIYYLPVPVINRATSQGLSGRRRNISEWIWLASKAGLHTTNFKRNSDNLKKNNQIELRSIYKIEQRKIVFVIDNQIIGKDIPPQLHKKCINLANLAKTRLLGIEFVYSKDQWIFVNADHCPDLRLGGQDLLDMLSKTLKRKKRYIE